MLPIGSLNGSSKSSTLNISCNSSKELCFGGIHTIWYVLSSQLLRFVLSKDINPFLAISMKERK